MRKNILLFLGALFVFVSVLSIPGNRYPGVGWYFLLFGFGLWAIFSALLSMTYLFLTRSFPKPFSYKFFVFLFFAGWLAGTSVFFTIILIYYYPMFLLLMVDRVFHFFKIDLTDLFIKDPTALSILFALGLMHTLLVGWLGLIVLGFFRKRWTK